MICRVFLLKRNIDILIIIIFSFLWVPIAILIFIINILIIGPPSIFSQKRCGLNGSTFYLYKFRTMNQKRNIEEELLPDHDRFTKLGKFLRKTSLDELPSLWNVLKGDMSLVGPRPFLAEYLEHY